MMTAVEQLSRVAVSLADTALATAAALWFGGALLAGPWALVSCFADFHGPRGLDSHFQATLTALEGLGDFGAFLAGCLQLLTGA